MSSDPTRPLRGMLRALLLSGLLGVGAELALIEHDEDLPQLIPLIALGAALLALGWDTFSGSPAARRCLRLALLGLFASAFAGLYYHYASNLEFKRELDPTLAGWGLFLATMRAQSPPALAPGVLGLLGAIGWIAIHVPKTAHVATEDTTT